MANRICVARIGAAHGVRGEVKLWSFTEDPAAVAHYGPLETQDGTRCFEIEALRAAKDHFVARIAGVNDREDQAWHLARLLAGLEVKINVIPLNEDPTYLPGWRRPDEAAIEAFVKILVDANMVVTVRRSKGPDASAACGQLKGRTVDPRKGGGRKQEAGGRKD